MPTSGFARGGHLDCQKTIKDRLGRAGTCETGTVRLPFPVSSPASMQQKGGFCPFDSAG